MLTIVCTRNSDVECILSKVLYKEKNLDNFKVYYCNHNNNDFALLVTGYGKVNIGVALEKLNHEIDITSIVHFGLASSISCSLKIFDILCADKVCDYDVDFTNCECSLGKFPDEEKNIYSSDYELKKYFIKAIDSMDKKYTDVIIASGEKFVSNNAFANFIRKSFYADALDNEAGAIGKFAAINNIPFLSIKLVSNYANERAYKDFKMYFSEASRLCQLVTYNFIKEYFM